ncbi:metal ABC transporter permease [soil metagenome]
MLDTLARFLIQIADTLNVPIFDVRAVVAIGLVSLACGLVGSFVVGNRMAFFSDAMAHTAFAGAALGVLMILLIFRPGSTHDAGDHEWVIPLVMVAFGIVVGLAIAFVRERTGLTADAVIGVFFAFAVGFGAMLIPELSRRVRFEPEQFLFGSAVFANESDIAGLILVVALCLVFVLLRFNGMTLAGFNPSLARTRSMNVRLNNYLFVILLSLVVNLSIKAVGVLLINALLIVPAAASANIARNVRQLFLGSVLISVGCSLGGYLFSRTTVIPLPGGDPIQLRPAGTIIVLSVLVFFLTAIIAAVRGRRIHGGDCC